MNEYFETAITEIFKMEWEPSDSCMFHVTATPANIHPVTDKPFIVNEYPLDIDCSDELIVSFFDTIANNTDVSFNIDFMELMDEINLTVQKLVEGKTEFIFHRFDLLENKIVLRGVIK